MSVDVRIEGFAVESQFGPLQKLFGSYFDPGNKLLTKSYLEWLYGRNPFGPARMVIAQDDGEWIGFMAMIPASLVKRGESIRAYYVVNVLVHPNYHGRNIFGRMIAVAKEMVAREGSALMGHPNDMALKSWRRAEMHFQPSLMPTLVLPWRSSGAQSFIVDNPKQLDHCCANLKTQAGSSEFWALDISSDYISWRYLNHPVNRYGVRRVDVGEHPVGLLISRRMRRGIHLLLDYFFVKDHEKRVLSACPIFSVGFQPRGPETALKWPKVAVPVKKQIPFFFTHYGMSFGVDDMRQVGLSLSDF
jgi:GNAT superfamily N-acetyltransferase